MALFAAVNFAIEGDGFLVYLSTHYHQFHLWYMLLANAAVVVVMIFFSCKWRLKAATLPRNVGTGFRI